MPDYQLLHRIKTFLSCNCYFASLLRLWGNLHRTLPPANEVWGKAMFYTCVLFCPHGGRERVCPTPSGCRPPWMQTPLGCRPPGVGQTTLVADPPDADPNPEVGQRFGRGLDADIPPPDTVNKRAVHILLECILVLKRVALFCRCCTIQCPVSMEGK